MKPIAEAMESPTGPMEFPSTPGSASPAANGDTPIASSAPSPGGDASEDASETTTPANDASPSDAADTAEDTATGGPSPVMTAAIARRKAFGDQDGWLGNQSKTTFLSSCQIFHECERAALTALTLRSVAAVHQPGEVLLRAGETTDYVWLVEEGECVVSLRGVTIEEEERAAELAAMREREEESARIEAELALPSSKATSRARDGGAAAKRAAAKRAARIAALAAAESGGGARLASKTNVGGLNPRGTTRTRGGPGEPRRVAVLLPKDAFGERCVLSSEPMRYTVACVGTRPVKVLKVPGKEFKATLKKGDEGDDDGKRRSREMKRRILRAALAREETYVERANAVEAARALAFTHGHEREFLLRRRAKREVAEKEEREKVRPPPPPEIEGAVGGAAVTRTPTTQEELNYMKHAAVESAKLRKMDQSTTVELTRRDVTRVRCRPPSPSPSPSTSTSTRRVALGDASSAEADVADEGRPGGENETLREASTPSSASRQRPRARSQSARTPAATLSELTPEFKQSGARFATPNAETTETDKARPLSAKLVVGAAIEQLRLSTPGMDRQRRMKHYAASVRGSVRARPQSAPASRSTGGGGAGFDTFGFGSLDGVRGIDPPRRGMPPPAEPKLRLWTRTGPPPPEKKRPNWVCGGGRLKYEDFKS